MRSVPAETMDRFPGGFRQSTTIEMHTQNRECETHTVIFTRRVLGSVGGRFVGEGGFFPLQQAAAKDPPGLKGT